MYFALKDQVNSLYDSMKMLLELRVQVVSYQQPKSMMMITHWEHSCNTLGTFMVEPLSWEELGKNN